MPRELGEAQAQGLVGHALGASGPCSWPTPPGRAVGGMMAKVTQTRRRTQKQSPCGQLGEGRGECGPWGGGVTVFFFSSFEQ